jgi:cytochrome c oxidase subunit II
MLNEMQGMMPNASLNGVQIDDMIEFCHWFMLTLFVGWTTFLFFCLFRFHHSRHPRANHLGATGGLSLHLEFSVVVIEAVLLLGFAIPLWARRSKGFPDPHKSIVVHAVAQQFLWNFHYPGPDGVFGRRDAALVSSSNPLGIDPNDPASQDDIVSTGEMHAPVNTPVIVDITSKDVVHNYSIPSMRISQDAIPGTQVPVWYHPLKEGQYEIVCGQLCGSGHGLMKAMLVVDNKDDYSTWMQERISLKGGAAAPAAVTGPASTQAMNPAFNQPGSKPANGVTPVGAVAQPAAR